MKIAVIGDLMLDVDILCEAERLCSEAPVPILREKSMQTRLGGAASVASMCAALGATTFCLGRASFSSEMGTLLAARGILYQLENGETTTKKRFFDCRDGRRSLMARVDHESRVPMPDIQAEVFVERITDFDPDAIIVADHGKGVVTESLLAMLQKDVPLFIDPVSTTPTNVRGVWVGGEHELPFGVGPVVITKLGSRGLRFYGPEVFSLPSYCPTVIDSIGAGDQFIASLAIARCRGLDWELACKLASRHAAEQCRRVGCQPVMRESA